jgi:hypothetical protein
MAKHNHGNFFQSEFLRGSQAGMAGDDQVFRVHQDWIGPAKLRDRRSDPIYLISGVRAGVLLVGDQ